MRQVKNNFLSCPKIIIIVFAVTKPFGLDPKNKHIALPSICLFPMQNWINKQTNRVWKFFNIKNAITINRIKIFQCYSLYIKLLLLCCLAVIDKIDSSLKKINHTRFMQRTVPSGSWRHIMRYPLDSPIQLWTYTINFSVLHSFIIYPNCFS